MSSAADTGSAMSRGAELQRGGTQGRLPWIDVARGIAVLWMMETHVCNALMGEAWKQTRFFANLTYVNGLVAPTFLFVSGHLLGRSLQRLQGAVRSRAWLRLAGLALCGYAIHFPVGALLRGDWQEAVKSGTQVDVLQCLAWIQCFFLVLGPRCRSVMGWVALACMGAFVFAAPAAFDVRNLPVPILAFLNQETGSLFPLFPWAGFVSAGVATGFLPVRWGWWVGCGLAALLAATLAKADPFTSASPQFFFERLAWVLLWVGGLQQWASGWSPRVLEFAGGRSLWMYVGHLILLGGLWGSGVRGLGPFGVILGFVWLGVGSLGSAWIWERFRADRKKRIEES